MRVVIAVIAPALVVGLAACSAGRAEPNSSAASSGTSQPSADVTGQVTVFAAASLKESFTTIGTDFEKAHPGVKVTFNFGGSSALANSIISGAPADVFASAAVTNMDQVVRAKLANAPSVFASNSMEIVVPKDNPGHLTALADLDKPGLKVVLCQPSVPCGAVGTKVLAAAHVNLTPVSLEPDVKGVMSKVQLGEADAGLVYVTDVRAGGDGVIGIPLPANANASTDYPIATMAAAPNKAAADGFMAYVLSAAGQHQLALDGFTRP